MVETVGDVGHSDRRELEIGHPGRDVQAGLSLHADRLQHIGVGRAANQEIAAAANAHRRIGADAAVRTGKLAATEPRGRSRRVAK
jgi:hypothetical protein